jgi:hypothetical protein
MQQDVIKQVINAHSPEIAMRVLSLRRDQILHAIGEGKLEPTEDVLGELFDLNVALGDADMFQDGES